MTEGEWLTASDPQVMLEYLRGRASDRKVRMFAVACCRRIWHLIEGVACRSAVEVSERYADGQASETERSTAEYELDAASSAVEAATYSAVSVEGRVAEGASHAARAAVAAAREATEWGNADNAPVGESHTQVAFLREIFGNPLRPVTLDSVWLSPTVIALAQAAYEERIMPSGELDPERLAVLSDALEEAGCDDADILGHLRSPGPHARGCWAVDLLLGKE